MKYKRIDNSLYVENRRRFVAKMEPNAVAIFNSNDVYPVSADSTMPFQQHRDILHLSGVDQEESILVLFPNAHNPNHREMLFVRETNEHIAIWEGEKLTKETAFDVSGIKSVFWLQQFDTIMKEVMAEAETIYVNTNEHTRANTEVQTREARFLSNFLPNHPGHKVRKSAPIMNRIRSIKNDIEIALMQEACDITCKGVKRVLDFVQPGVMEFEIEAELMHEFLCNRSRGFAYTPIVASGKNATVLHYVENNQECKDGDLVLMDVGAEYANYASDSTRCFPVNGRFTERQKEIYNAVLHVKNESEKLLIPGTLLGEYHKEVGNLMTDQLLQLGLLDKTDVKNQNPDWPAYKKFFMHGTSHFIGLDTHDSGLWREPLKPGMVFTCEPGIYIREEGLGVRLEDDLVIQESGAPKNLMKDIPLTIEEVEDVMNG